MRYLYLNLISKECRVYALGAVLIPLAVAVAILAWAGGNLRTTIFFGALSVSWLIYTLVEILNIHRQRKASEKRRATLRTPRSRRKIILLKIFWLFILICGIAGLAIVLVRDMPLYIILEAVFIIILGAGQLIFTILVPDK